MASRVHDETGTVLEKIVPKSHFRKKIALFFFENRSGSPEIDWLQYAIPGLLEIDLSQELFIETLSPGNQNFSGSFYMFNKIKDAGFNTGTGLPLMLMKKISKDLFRDYFLTGGIRKQGSDFDIDYVLYRTVDLRPVAKGQIRNGDIFDAIDELSEQLKKGLEIPGGHLDKTPDLPVGELFTRSMPAARAFIEGGKEVLLNQDWKKAEKYYMDAVAIGPGFSYANIQLAALYAQTSQSDKWRSTLKVLMQQSYKLPERQQSFIKINYYMAMQEPDKSMAVLDMMATLCPEDTQVYFLRAQMRIARNSLDLALLDYQKIRELDPQNVEILKSIASLHESKGNYPHAEKFLLEFGETFPGDSENLLSLGKIKRKQGDHETAQAYFHKAQLLSPDDVAIIMELAKSKYDSGQFSESLMMIEKAGSLAISAEEKYTAFAALEDFYTQRGQMKLALETFDKKIAEHKKFNIPLMSVIVSLDRAELLVLNGRAGEAYEFLDELKKQMSPPFDKYVALGYISALLAEKKADEAERPLSDIRDLIKQTGVTALGAYISKVESRIAEIREEYDKTLELCLEVKKKSPTASVERSLAACYRYFKEYDKGEDILRQALLISPFSAPLNHEAARLNWDMGKKEEALIHLNRVLTIWQDADPEYAPARLAREQLQSWSS